MAVQVREAIPADAETIAAFARALSLEEGYPAPALQAQHVRKEGFGASARFRALIAERDGRPVGYALFYRATLPNTPSAVCTCRTSTSCPRRAARGRVGR